MGRHSDFNKFPHNIKRLKKQVLTKEKILSKEVKNNIEVWANVGNGPVQVELISFSSGGLKIKYNGNVTLVFLKNDINDINDINELGQKQAIIFKRSDKKRKRVVLSSNSILRKVSAVEDPCTDYNGTDFWERGWTSHTTWDEQNHVWFADNGESDISIFTTPMLRSELDGELIKTMTVSFQYDFENETTLNGDLGFYPNNFSAFTDEFPSVTFPAGQGTQDVVFNIDTTYLDNEAGGIYVDVYMQGQNLSISNIEICLDNELTVVVPEIVEPDSTRGSYYTLSPALETTQFETINGNDVHVNTNWVVRDVFNSNNIIVNETLGPETVSQFPFDVNSSPLEQGGQYRFNARHEGQTAGWSDFSDDSIINIADLTLNPNQANPENGTSFDKDREGDIVFDASLSGVTDVTISKLQVEVIDNTETVVFDTGVVDGSSVSIDTVNFDYGTEYKWKMRRYTNDLLWSQYSDNIDIYSHVLSSDPTILYTFEVEPGTTPGGDPADGTTIRSVNNQGIEEIWNDPNIAIGGRSTESAITPTGDFIVGDDENIYSFDDSANLLWTYTSGSGYDPIYYSEDNSVAYIYESQQTVTGLDSTGTEVFSVNVPITNYTPPFNGARHDLLVDVSNDRILVANSHNTAAIFDLAGNEIWSTTQSESIEDEGFKGIFKSNDGNYLFISSDLSGTNILKIDSNGNSLASTDLDFSPQLSFANTYDLELIENILYIRQTQVIHAFDISSLTSGTIPELFRVTRNDMFESFSSVPSALDFSTTDISVYNNGIFLISSRIDSNESDFIGKNGAVTYVYRDTGKVFETVLYDKQIEAIEYLLETSP